MLTVKSFASQLLNFVPNFTMLDTSISSKVSDCNGVVLHIYSHDKFQLPQEILNCETFIYEKVT